jgi:Flp pilus assembly protein TadG
MSSMKRFQRLQRDESGMTYVFIGMGFMAFLSATMLAIDVGMLMTARSQAQNSADAGALAGATALVFDDYDDRSPSGPAVTNAINGATFNRVMAHQVSVNAGDVQFLNDPTGEPNRVRVTVRRTASRGNPVSTLIAAYFGVVSTDIGAVATAEASPANAMTCVKPFTIPDRWREMPSRNLATADDSFDWMDRHGRRPAVPDSYVGPDDPDNYTGYNAQRDAGMEIVIKADNGSRIAPSFYYPWAMNGQTGASEYRWNIGNCNIQLMEFGQTYTTEPGNMVGPTQQGISDLIALDPHARWDDSTDQVVTTMNPSPRVVAIPLFDPVYYAEGIQQGRNATLRFVNYLGLFIEGMRGGEVVGRITPIGGLRRGGLPNAPPAAFPRSIRLVE